MGGTLSIASEISICSVAVRGVLELLVVPQPSTTIEAQTEIIQATVAFSRTMEYLAVRQTYGLQIDRRACQRGAIYSNAPSPNQERLEGT